LIDPALEQVLRGDEGERFCFVLRDAYTEAKQVGHISPGPSASDRGRLIGVARQLSLLDEVTPTVLRWTPVGYEIANVAKEYCNWIEAGRTLPEGVTREVIAGRRVLDVGCSFGRHLVSFAANGASATYGIDLQENYLRLSRIMAARERVPPPRLSRAAAEELPFRDQQFDVVFSRLVLNYVGSVDRALSEMSRVLVPGGRLILRVDTLADSLRVLRRMHWIGNMRSTLWQSFGIVNTLWLEATGHQLSVKARGRMYGQHSPTWPRDAWLRRQLPRYGLSPIGDADIPGASIPGLVHAIRVSSRV
jgi:ubiquinone/menaquinone biosynthesis C-methylase UbiE